jgi:KTSC domain
VSPDAKQIQLSSSSRGIVDHFFCFTCDQYVWDCDHLIEERLLAPRVAALMPSQLQSFAYDGNSRVLEIEFRVPAPFIHGEAPLPPPPHVVQYFAVPRYVFTKLLACKTARRQERYWEDNIRNRYKCETVRTVCRLPRRYGMSEARNIRRFSFEDYVSRLAIDEGQRFHFVVVATKILLLKTLSPRRAAGLGGLLQCRSCESVGVDLAGIRHRNCVWFQIHSPRNCGRHSGDRR